MSSTLVHHERVRALAIVDHVVLADRIGEGLRDAGFAVDVAYDGVLAAEPKSGYDLARFYAASMNNVWSPRPRRVRPSP